MQLLLPWMNELTLQQQAVLVLACRGFDGEPKHSPHKPLVRTIRAHCLTAARFGRAWTVEDGYNDFMTLDYIDYDADWNKVCDHFIEHWDSYNIHATMHLVHAGEVLGYKLPSVKHRKRWNLLYNYIAQECLHMLPETEEQMDNRLNDWGREFWARPELTKDLEY